MYRRESAKAVSMRACLLATVIGMLVLYRNASAQTDKPAAVMASRIDVAPVIDGRGTDVAWMSGPEGTDFRDFAPREGAEPALRTSVRIRYDDHALYFLVRAFDPHPDSIVRRVSRRDTFDATADQIRLLIDPLHDRRTGVEFVVTASGVKADATLFDDTGEDYSWDGVWDVATSIDSLGWVAEFAIPFHQLHFVDHHAPTFGIFVARWVGRSGERSSLPQYSRAAAGLVSQMGSLGGLRDLAATSALEATPYVVGRARNLPSRGAETASLEARPIVGADIKWAPRANVNIDATLNPDFGQIEADPANVNLTGVEIFQSERRPFFLEGAGLLALPLAADGSGQLFYSRRIGRRPVLTDDFGAPDSPTETTILGAAKITARITPSTSVAALTAVTGQAEGRVRPDHHGSYVIEPRAIDLVARLQQNFRDGRSGIGMMMTRVDRDGTDATFSALLPLSAQTVALTTQHQTSDGVYQANGWLANSDVRGLPSAIARLQRSAVHAYQRPDDGVAFDSTRDALRGAAAFVSVSKVGGGITRFAASYRRVDPGFDVNDLGFFTKSGVQSASASVGLDQSMPGHIAGVAYRRANLTLGYAGDWFWNGLPYARGLTLDGGFQLSSLAQVQLTLKQELPGALCAVSCTRGGPALVDLPRSTMTADITGDPRRAFVPHATVEYDRDDEGRSHGYGARVDGTWRIRSNLDVFLGAYAFNTLDASAWYGQFGEAPSDTTHFAVARLDLPTRSLTSRINYTLTNALTLQWYGQAYISRGVYDDLRELADPRSPDWSARFRPFGSPALRASPGGVDFKQLRSNAVLRWEYRPGSTFFAVWSQGRDMDGATASRLGLWPGRDLRELFALRPLNTIAVKLSYWINR